jgi:hypothetical protein
VPKSNPEGNPSRRLRCAIYTRKSTEEGLEQEFSSLEAQREAAEAFIQSQRREGLPPIPGPTRNYRERCHQLTGIDPLQCPKCNRGTMVRIAALPIVRLAAISNSS